MLSLLTFHINPEFVDITVDFIRVYADKCHHGKEKDILFRDLQKKNLSDEHKRIIKELITDFYPKHIEKEDKHFFLPCMGYFTPEEKESMLNEGWEYDKNLIHEIYKEKISIWTKGSG